MSEKTDKLIQEIEKLTVLELNELVKSLEDKFGTVAIATPAASNGGGAENAVQEKSEYTIVLEDTGANKINVIKAVREINNTLGLKEAKDLVETAPKTIAEGVKKEDAETAKKKLEEAGAKVSLK